MDGISSTNAAMSSPDRVKIMSSLTVQKNYRIKTLKQRKSMKLTGGGPIFDNRITLNKE